MGTASHTPGPWKAGSYSSVVGIPITAQPDKTKNTVVVASTIQASSREEAEANARLISVAPDLLALAREIATGFCTAADMHKAQRIIAKVEGQP